MPFHKEIRIPTGIIGIWRISEPENILYNLVVLDGSEELEYNETKNERRKKEFLAVRLLLAKLLGRPVHPVYRDDGRPFIPDSFLNISIAHSVDFAVVILSAHNVGIDVEALDRPVRKIAPKFMSEQELDYVSGLPEPETGMLITWCAKEAVFKCTHKNGIDFRTQISISPFIPITGHEFSARLTAGNITEDFTLQYLKIDDNALVWCIEANK
jgi:4'-phosphopantetheinyl transferase